MPTRREVRGLRRRRDRDIRLRGVEEIPTVISLDLIAFAPVEDVELISLEDSAVNFGDERSMISHRRADQAAWAALASDPRTAAVYRMDGTWPVPQTVPAAGDFYRTTHKATKIGLNSEMVPMSV